MKDFFVNTGKMDAHDFKVVAFHLLFAAIQAVLIQLGKENFGSYTAIVALFVQTGLELVRRFVV